VGHKSEGVARLAVIDDRMLYSTLLQGRDDSNL